MELYGVPQVLPLHSDLSRRARETLAALVDDLREGPQASPASGREHILDASSEIGLGRVALALLRKLWAADPNHNRVRLSDVASFCRDAWADELMTFLAVCSSRLDLPLHESPAPSACQEEFEKAVNDICRGERFPYRLSGGDWQTAGERAVCDFSRALLLGGPPPSMCRQRDIQVEMVVSTILPILSESGKVLVDYGAGLGRIVDGLRTARRFSGAKYIAVESPIPDQLRVAANQSPGNAKITCREDFLTSDVKADVIMLVNTLHHIPFCDIGRQIGILFEKLNDGGYLLIHDMEELKQPEQLNVPWTLEDVELLFDGPSFDVNARRAAAGPRGTSLIHVQVMPTWVGEFCTRLTANVGAVWMEMKRRVLDEIRALYETEDASDSERLIRALATNANLDLNIP